MYTYSDKPSFIRRHKILVVIILLATFGLIGGASLYAFHLGPFKESSASQTVGVPVKSTDYNPPTADQTKAGETVKQQSANGAVGSDPSPAPTPPADGSSKSTVGMEITAANVDAGILHIRTLIQTISSSGTCTLTMSGPNGKSYTASAAVQAGPSTSTCKGFDVPTSSLSTGSWSVRVTFENASLQASASTDKSL